MLTRLLALLLLCSPAMADEIAFPTPIQLRPYVGGANLAETIQIQGFNPALGTLTAVRIDVDVHEEITARGENVSPGAALLVWKSQAGLALSTVTDQTLFIAPLQPHTLGKRCTKYDGVTDFGGTSGFTLPDKGESLVFSIYQTGDPSELQRFVGVGSKPFKAWRLGLNSYSGATGKGTAGLKHLVGGRILTIYVYSPATP